MKQNSIKINYNILDFEFSCVHECHEGRYGEKRCSHCISRTRCVNEIRPVYPSEEGIYYLIDKIEISPSHVEDLGTYIHEFTEATIIRILRRYRKNWHGAVTFKKEGLHRTYITHVISPYGANNNTCLNPATKHNRPKW